MGRAMLYFYSGTWETVHVHKTFEKAAEELAAEYRTVEKMGGRYIFSAVPIDNAAENGLVLDRVFTSDESAWTIYLYKVK